MEKLFVYGTLQPGGPNERVMTAIGGHWQAAVIKGRLKQAGWGAGLGFPGLVLDSPELEPDAGNEIHGYIFTSPNLGSKWAELDAFEGEEYRRVTATVILDTGESVAAQVYVLRR